MAYGDDVNLNLGEMLALLRHYGAGHIEVTPSDESNNPLCMVVFVAPHEVERVKAKLAELDEGR